MARSTTSRHPTVAEAIARSEAIRRQRLLTPLRMEILQAVIELGADAYGARVVDVINANAVERGEPKHSDAKIYNALNRLAEADPPFLVGETKPSPVPGARRVTVYSLTGAAKQALADAA